MDLDLFNLNYKELKYDNDSMRERFLYFQAKGHSAQELAEYFHPYKRSRTHIYNLWNILFGRGFVKVPMRKNCVVCGLPLKKNAGSIRMHKRCRSGYFKGLYKEEVKQARAEGFQQIYSKILRG